MIIVLIILFLNLVSASFTKGNVTANIDTQYSPGESLKGWINISLQDEPADALLTAFNKGTSILDFLNKNSYKDFTCKPTDCKENYISTNGQETKSFSLGYGEEKIISFLAEGTISSIGYLEFNVSVDNTQSCINPLEIDVLNDGEAEWKSKKFSDEISCAYMEGRGCFNINENLYQAVIDDEIPYCEKIKLIESNNFSLGAWVKKGSTVWKDGLLKMYLYSLDGSLLGSCNLLEPSSNGGEISCLINYKNNELQEYYVCIKATNKIEGYETKRESVEPCGFYAFPGEETEYNDYYIFTKSSKFDTIGEFNFNQAEYEKQENSGGLSDYIFQDYIDERYEGNCTKGCGIPLKFTSYGDLDIEISNAKLKYSTGAGPKTTNLIYDAAKETAKINSNFLTLDLSLSNITVPLTRGKYTLSLYLGSGKILEQDISVGNVAVIDKILPTHVSAAIPTKFIVSASGNVTGYKWDFGDGTKVETTTNNSIYHTYKEIGAYNLKIIAINKAGEASKTFTIEVKSPEEELNNTLTEKIGQLNKTKKQLESITAWYKEELKKEAALDEIDSKLNDLENQYKTASTADEYVKIMSQLSELEVPYSLQIHKFSWDFFPAIEQIEPAYLTKIGLKEDNPEKYKDSIAGWFNEMVEMKVESNVPYLYYPDKQSLLFTTLTLKIKPKKDFSDEVYLIINKRYDEIKFNPNKDYKPKAVEDATAIIFSELKKDREEIIDFILPEEIKVNELPVFMSPDFSRLPDIVIAPCDNDGVCEKEAEETNESCPNDCHSTPWKKIITYLLILLFVAFVVYIALQEWYKRYYEGHLFKNKNDLFNLINFVSNAISQGFNKKELFKELKEYGWSGEQIIYAFKKAQGKRTGMWEIPIFRPFEKRKLKKELEKRKNLGFQPPRQNYYTNVK